MGKLGLVLSGGGARGAYEAGVIAFMRSALPKNLQKSVFEIQCGSSAGAINSAAMVATAHDPILQGNWIREIWENLKPDDVYRRDFSDAAKFISSSFFGVLRNVTTLDLFKVGKSKGPHLNAFLNTDPLKVFLDKHLSFNQLQKNILKGPVDALSLSVTNAKSGRCELFISKKSHITYTGEYRIREAKIGSEHILASSAIPIIFPSIKIGQIYYADGGLRLFTPFSPAIQLGADRIVVVGLRHRATEAEIAQFDDAEMKQAPTMAQLGGRLMNMIFLDRVEYDMQQLRRINRVIEWSEEVYGKSYLEKINAHLRKSEKRDDIAGRGLKKIRTVEITPSQFISDIYQRWFDRLRKGVYKLTTMEKLLLRVLDVDATGAVELLSYLTFSKDYLKELIELGYEDARKQKNELIDILEK